MKMELGLGSADKHSNDMKRRKNSCGARDNYSGDEEFGTGGGKTRSSGEYHT